MPAAYHCDAIASIRKAHADELSLLAVAQQEALQSMRDEHHVIVRTLEDRREGELRTAETMRESELTRVTTDRDQAIFDADRSHRTQLSQLQRELDTERMALETSRRRAAEVLAQREEELDVHIKRLGATDSDESMLHEQIAALEAAHRKELQKAREELEQVSKASTSSTDSAPIGSRPAVVESS